MNAPENLSVVVDASTSHASSKIEGEQPSNFISNATANPTLVTCQCHVEVFAGVILRIESAMSMNVPENLSDVVSSAS